MLTEERARAALKAKGVEGQGDKRTGQGCHESNGDEGQPGAGVVSAILSCVKTEQKAS